MPGRVKNRVTLHDLVGPCQCGGPFLGLGRVEGPFGEAEHLSWADAAGWRWWVGSVISLAGQRPVLAPGGPDDAESAESTDGWVFPVGSGHALLQQDTGIIHHTGRGTPP